MRVSDLRQTEYACGIKTLKCDNFRVKYVSIFNSVCTITLIIMRSIKVDPC